MSAESNPPSAQAARDLLREAGRLGAAARTGASWPHIAMLLGMGAISSLSLISFWLVGRFDESLIAIPLIAMLIWLGIFMGVMLAFGRSTKRGFGRRWITFMAIWGALWVIGVGFGTTLAANQLWFTLSVATAITLNSAIGAWVEARK
ncbi:hypothetical protein [Paeniglutamicibacter cryotolerans]|uniref:Uncharacterized protein n=1 Tax=Paeniglutamicibacter cryotolerans TaxID=670079 RepID=A0A839QJL6_9MICC|nr:hypothetical protein [Paeniglutamicibacter cryotolerans]MBB2996017.1 hypothetical protein [Paeniglutamicibacter cryotolerans]